MRDIKRVETRVPQHQLDLWRHHRKNAGYESDREALASAMQLHTEYLLSGRKSTFLTELMIDQNDEARAKAIADMAHLLKRRDCTVIINDAGEVKIVNMSALRATMRGITYVLIIALILMAALGIIAWAA